MLSTVEKTLFLRSVELFRRIPGEELAFVAHIATERDFRQGETLIEEGADGGSMLLIVSGTVSVEKSGTLITELGERECVGEISLLDRAPRSASVIAKSPVRTLEIPHDAFFPLMAEHPEILRAVVSVLTRRLRTTTGRGTSVVGAA